MSEETPKDSSESPLEPGDQDDFFESIEREAASSPKAYTEIRELGQGGMARVVLVEDPTFDREVAMKVALPDCQEDPALLRRFLNEARITSHLDHPTIPPVHDAGAGPDGLRYFTMKWVRGATLASILLDLADPSEGMVEAYSLPRLLQIFLQVCEGIAFAHDRSIIHRDLKPENIMVGRFGQVFVMDWGLAKILGEEEDPAADAAGQTGLGDGREEEKPPWSPGATRAPSDPMRTPLPTPGTVPDRGLPATTPTRTVKGAIVGTPTYMAPEQAAGRGELVDRQSDIYALGATLYEILTLAPPVEDENTAMVLMRIMDGDIDPPRIRAPERSIPPELEAVCLKA
ncbi:MAG: serine/threonine-protein kinase, partial [Planctomycetota bacterium]